MKLDNLIKEIKDLSFEDRTKLYTVCFGFGALDSKELNTKLILVSLVALTSGKLKEKNPKMTTLDLLVKITGEKPGTFNYTALENLAIITDDLSYNTDIFDPCGLTNSTDIINKIKELLQTWTPF
jgi:hypothetical protein